MTDISQERLHEAVVALNQTKKSTFFDALSKISITVGAALVLSLAAFIWDMYGQSVQMQADIAALKIEVTAHSVKLAEPRFTKEDIEPWLETVKANTYAVNRLASEVARLDERTSK